MKMNQFGPYIREKRESLKATDRVFSVRQVAERAGLEPSYLSKIERGEQAPPSESKIRALAKDLGEDPDMLLAMAGKVSTDLQEIIPIETYNQELFLRGHRMVELSDDDYTYLLKFVNYKIKNDISPLDFERNDIRDIIINKRKMMFIQKARNDIYKQALKNNDFEIYIHE